MDTSQLTRPLLRGAIHQAAFPVALVLGALLTIKTDGDRRHLAAAIFSASVAICFGLSALYHRITWTPELRLRMRRLDHAGVYLLIAGTYTPVALLELSGAWRTTILTITWAGAALAITQRFLWSSAPKWVAAALSLAIGWGGIAALPQIVTRLGAAGSTLLITGGLIYSAGAIVYVLRRPDPLPRIFGYHELFHTLTIIAVACQYSAIAFFVLHVA